MRVRYFATTALVQQLQLARTQLRLEDALHKLDRYAALILDDFGYVKNLRFRVVGQYRRI